MVSKELSLLPTDSSTVGHETFLPFSNLNAYKSTFTQILPRYGALQEALPRVGRFRHMQAAHFPPHALNAPGNGPWPDLVAGCHLGVSIYPAASASPSSRLLISTNSLTRSRHRWASSSANSSPECHTDQQQKRIRQARRSKTPGKRNWTSSCNCKTCWAKYVLPHRQGKAARRSALPSSAACESSRSCTGTCLAFPSNIATSSTRLAGSSRMILHRSWCDRMLQSLYRLKRGSATAPHLLACLELGKPVSKHECQAQ